MLIELIKLFSDAWSIINRGVAMLIVENIPR